MIMQLLYKWKQEKFSFEESLDINIVVFPLREILVPSLITFGIE